MGSKKWSLLALTAILVMSVAPSVSAAHAGSVGGSGQSCIEYDILKITSVVETGPAVFCMDFIGEVHEGSTFMVLARLSGPSVLGLGIDITWDIETTGGCTAGTPVETGYASAAATSSNYRFAVTMTDEQCYGVVSLDVVDALTGAIEILYIEGIWNTVGEDHRMTITGDLNNTLSGAIDVDVVTVPELMGQFDLNLTDAVELKHRILEWPVLEHEGSTELSGTVAVEAAPGSEAPALDLLTIIAMVLVGVLIWAKTEPLPLRYGGTILVATAGLLCFELTFAQYILVPLGIVLMALGAYGFYEIPRSDKMKRDEFSLGGL